ncbi:hypothetical protein [Derxia lacustris]|uniref:hypothetical protein n=1 Tax=Derxia lacustris TaxID=764842 RepID=UPI000A1779BA|nr:hypothetical protein [Derxia lacustris]
MSGNQAINIALAAMNQARNGGDFNELFRGRKLAFKLSGLRDAACEIRDAANEAASEVGPVLATASSPIVDAVIAVARVIRDGGTAMLGALKSAFQRLIDVFTSLKEALVDAFQPLLGAMGMAIDALVNLLFDLLPNVFVEFVKGIVAAILPFIGQIKACASMLLAVGGVVRSAIERRRLVRAAGALDERNRFSTAARTAILGTIDDELRSGIADAAMETVNAGVSVAGLVFTGHAASLVSGIATAVAKLCIKVAGLVNQCRMLMRGNALLARITADPAHDVNPSALFTAAPILGCHYLVSATQSSLIANTGFATSIRAKLATSAQSWQAQYQAKAAQLSPLRTKAFELCKASPLELTSESRLGIYFDLSLKDEAKEKLSGAAESFLGQTVSASVMARMA